MLLRRSQCEGEGPTDDGELGAGRHVVQGGVDNAGVQPLVALRHLGDDQAVGAQDVSERDMTAAPSGQQHGRNNVAGEEAGEEPPPTCRRRAALRCPSARWWWAPAWRRVSLCTQTPRTSLSG